MKTDTRIRCLALLSWALLVPCGCGGESRTDDPPTPPPPPQPPPSQTPPVPAPQLGPGPSWVDLRLPLITGWELRPPEDQGPVQGYHANYQHDGAGVGAHVYVYNAGRTGIRRDEALLREELARATAEVHQSHQQGAYEAVRELDTSMTRLGSSASAPVAALQRFGLTNGGVERQNSIYVSTHRAFFVKIRTTIQTGPSPAADQAIAALLEQLGAVLRADDAGAQQPSPSTLGNTRITSDGRNVWPPTGPGCDVLVRCCEAAQATESSVALFCQISAAAGRSCAEQLESVRTYIRERGTALPAACQ